MNAGTDYAKARRQAQANANRSGRAWVISGYGGVWWIGPWSGADRDGVERVEPTQVERDPERSDYTDPDDE